MQELPAMDPCPIGKGGHHLSVILPENNDGDLTLFCDRCGSIRRVPVEGRLIPASPLDEVDVAHLFAE